VDDSSLPLYNIMLDYEVKIAALQLKSELGKLKLYKV
jgi:hypothetical protein